MKTGTGMWIATTVQRGPLDRLRRIRIDGVRASYRYKVAKGGEKLAVLKGTQMGK